MLDEDLLYFNNPVYDRNESVITPLCPKNKVV
jgi:hypothetical protein